MSLVGSELNLHLDFDNVDVGKGQDVNMSGLERTPVPSSYISDILEDPHAPPTPLSGMENFFLGGLSTRNISASALAQELNNRHTPLLSAPSTSHDYVTASSDVVSEFWPSTEAGEENSLKTAISQEHSRAFKFDSLEEPENTMSTTSTKPTIAKVPTPVAEDVDQPMHVDPAEKIYDTVKNVWGWGKGVFIFKPFLGLAEGIAGKVVGTTGSSLSDVDSLLTGKLQGLDDGILNPAIKILVQTVLGATNKTKDFVTPIIVVLLKPIDFLLKNKPENESKKTPPEVTPNVDSLN